MNASRWTTVFSLLVLAGLVLAACAPQTVVETVVVTEVVEGQVIERVVTPTPAPVTFESPDPTTMVVATFGDPETLDPAWNYETAGNTIIMNVYETLVFYNRQNANEFVPQLATSWEISDDGTTYTFHIREGVTFHQGGELTPSDVAWSFQRGILQGGTFSPQWLLVEPFFGVGKFDIADVVAEAAGLEEPPYDDREAMAAVDPEVLRQVCEDLTSRIVADDAAGTVTMKLAVPWGPFLATIAQGWGAIQDKEWAIEQGAWDGDCGTWQNYYGVNEETTPLRDKMNGTGPFMLESWTPGEEIVLVRNPNYWRTEEVGPAWEGGPVGPAALERVVIKNVTEWGTRFAMLQAGDADMVAVPRENISQVDPLVGEICEYNPETLDFDCAPSDNPNGPLRLYKGHPTVARTDAFFVFEINTEGGNPFIGSGQLDGNGIPPDFFQDVHVRRAFNYCFDWETFINETLQGEAVQNVGVLIPGMLGYDPNGPHYTFDLDKCKEEIEQAWDGKVAEVGFRFQIAYNTGNTTRQTVAEILQQSFQQIDPKYQIEVVALPWPTFLANIRASRIPMFISGWLEDIHDPHNWAQPFTVGTYGSRQRMPEEMREAYAEVVNAGVAATDPEERAEIYGRLDDLDFEFAPAIRLAVATGRHYEQRWVQGWYYNPVYPGEYFYALSKK